MTMLDSARFDQLPETEVLRRIGGHVALLVERGRLPRRRASLEPLADSAALDLIADPTERAIATYLTRHGAATATQLASELARPVSGITRALCRLRAKGFCERIGRTSAARYQLRRDFSGN